MSDVELEGRRVRLTSLERVLWPDTGFTKGDLVRYYLDVARALVPHLAGRPLTLWRFPTGVHERGWWQNACRGHPPWLRTAELRGQRFCVVDDAPSLAWVANQGTVELHPFPVLADAPAEPTLVVFDLDPGAPADLLTCCEVGLRLRELLEELGLCAFAKTSGSRGLHVCVPLNAAHGFERTKAFASAVAVRLADAWPERVVAVQRRSARPGRVLVDWLQNDPTRSTVAPYSLRATRQPHVSLPVTWEEVEHALRVRRPQLLTAGPDAALARLDRLGDLFQPVLELVQMLPDP